MAQDPATAIENNVRNFLADEQPGFWGFGSVWCCRVIWTDTKWVQKFPRSASWGSSQLMMQPSKTLRLVPKIRRNTHWKTEQKLAKSSIFVSIVSLHPDFYWDWRACGLLESVRILVALGRSGHRTLEERGVLGIGSCVRASKSPCWEILFFARTQQVAVLTCPNI